MHSQTRIQREESLLLFLKKLDYLNRSQIQSLLGLTSIRNTNRFLQEMKTYLSSFRDGYETIYYLNAEGRHKIGCEKTRKKTIQAKHFIMRNQVYIAFQNPDYWRKEIKIEDANNKKNTVICDAIFKVNGNSYILEVDNEQKMIKNKAKIEKYKAIHAAGVFQGDPNFFRKFPELIWITTSEYRRKHLKEMCGSLQNEVFTMSDLI
ncbi:replication-relaxation family protein [Fictibacillus phosphorivorans]|uniref:replication-relaxation family protein n=1 Tax=Fictibacillus phosphorivorans TaxID=1221500 RepID=UPI003CF359EF